jgi:phosphatidate cytidylyltransferase
VLKQRLLTIAILLPLFVWCILVLPTQYFALLTAFIVLIGAWEWGRLMGLRPDALRIGWMALVLGIMVLSVWLITLPGIRHVVMAAAVIWWFVALTWIRRFGRDPDAFGSLMAGVPDARFPPHVLLGMLGIITLVPAWLALVILHGSALSGEIFVLLLMLLVWGADSGAYASGRLWGSRLLAPRVSPGKTWEGVYGALAVAIVVSVGAGLWLGFSWISVVTLALLGLVTVLFSIVGDLFESMIKRLAGVKDSGHLLPGHGGVLDRIDSITAAAPVFVLGLLWQGVVP